MSTAPAAAPVSAPAPAPAGAPAAPTPAPAPAQSSLFIASTTDPAPTPSPAPAPADPAATPPAPAAKPALPDWLPDKYAVFGADGALDKDASGKKMAEGLAAAHKRIGTGDLPPETADKYVLTIPDSLKEAKLDSTAFNGFREKALKAGYTQAQFDLAASEFFELVPELLNGAAAATAEQARAELSKVWTAPADLAANLEAGQRAITSLPAALQQQVVSSRLGTDAVFAQVVAAFGRDMREDRPPTSASLPAADGRTREQLMQSEAYRNPKHADHAAVSKRVQDMARRQFGEAPIN